MAVIGRPAPPSKLSSSDIADNAVTSAHIQTDALTHADLAPNSVTNSEMADDAVGIAELSASGTPNATSFLRGDNSWQVVDTEGTGIKSTGESGGSKFLREDGDGTSSWQTAGSPSITDNGNATALTIGADEGLTINGSLQQLTNRNLTGTYSSHELFIADGFTLTGNITVNEDIVLTKLSDDGNSITLTTDGNSQTITGSGSIEASTLAQTPVTSVDGMTGTLGSGVTIGSGATISNSVQDSITRLGTVTTGDVIQTYPVMRQIQHQYGGKDSSTGQVISSSNTDTMTGAPHTVQTGVFSTGNYDNTVWKLEGYAGVNNESSATNWNCSFKIWVSYDGGSSWSNALPGHSNVGEYLAYTDHGDEYTFIHGFVYNTGIPKNQTNTVFGLACYSHESDNTRWHMGDSLGTWISCTQYQTS